MGLFENPHPSLGDGADLLAKFPSCGRQATTGGQGSGPALAGRPTSPVVGLLGTQWNPARLLYRAKAGTAPTGEMTAMAAVADVNAPVDGQVAVTGLTSTGGPPSAPT